MNRGASRYLLITASAVLVLVGVVAVASSGSTPGGTNRTRPPAYTLVDTLFSLAPVLLILTLGLFVYGLMQRKAIAREVASGKYPRTGIGTVLGAVLIAAMIAYARLHGWGPFAKSGDAGLPRVPSVGDAGGTKDPVEHHAEFQWVPVLVILGLATIAAAAFIVADRMRRQPLPLDDAAAAEDAAELLDDSFDDLRAEPEPRRAVIAAYARLERTLGSVGLPRRRAETAEEFVTRIMDRLEVARAPVTRLTEHFTYAKFSQHDVTLARKEDAITALAEIRDELRAVARRKAEEHALVLAPDRTGTAPS